ncbi:MAG: 3'-5' exonuclease [Bacteroidota bacterium]
MYLGFDTETTGLPKKNALDENQPHTVQLAAILTDNTGRIMSEMCHIIKPDGWIIPDESIAVHGITNEMAHKYGLSREAVLSQLINFCRRSEMLVAHNAAFDLQMMELDFRRAGMANPMLGKEIFCTALGSANVLKIPPTERMKETGYGGSFKNPNLQELHKFLFDQGFDGAHNAMEDTQACMRCFFELKRRAV